MVRKSYDYIITGAGPSGCLAASRLAGEFGASVLLLEAGPPNTHPLLKMPAGFMKMLGGSKYLTFHETIPQKQLDGRVHQVPQGRVLGGGSSVNAMVYMRGRPSDYAAWNAAAGNAIGWGWDDMLPHYTRLESNETLGGAAHGKDGALRVSVNRNICAMSRIFVETMQGMGHALRDDFNGGEQRGVGFMQITTRDGKRCGAVEAFLDPVRHNRNLAIRTHAKVAKIITEKGRARGVVMHGSGEEIFADGEVILAAGAFATPQLLMLSGIGPAQHLRDHDIDVIADLRGVGGNLMDHHEVPIVATTNGHYGYYGEDRGWRMLRNGLRYLLTRSGPVASNGCESCAFINPLAPGDAPTIQFYCVPTVYLDRDVADVKPADGVTLNACLLQPQARGSVRLRSNNPADLPLVDSNYLGHPEDIRQEIAGLRFAREVLAAQPMKKYITGEIFPGTDAASDAALLAHCKKTVKTNYHPCGTCRMGREGDPDAVLTPDLRVKGVERLRVIDVSMMPLIPSGNTNAPAMAVADRAVDIMMG